MTHLDPATRAFLVDLKVNNNRDWFADNKARYDAARSDFESLVAALLSRIGTFDDAVADLDP